MANLQSTNVVGTLCVNGVAIGGGKDLKYCCFTGSTTWTPPSDLVTGDGVVDALLVGGGGGGTGLCRTAACQCCFTAGGGGGGGAIIKALLTMTSSNDACTITIGAGGNGGSSTGSVIEDGQPGGNTVFGNSGSGSDSAIAFGGGAGAFTNCAGNVFGRICSGSTMLRGGGGGTSAQVPKYNQRAYGGHGGSSQTRVMLHGGWCVACSGNNTVGNSDFIQGYRGSLAHYLDNPVILPGQGLKGYAQSYYVNPTDPNQVVPANDWSLVSGSFSWGAGGSGGGSGPGGVFGEIGGGYSGQNNNGQPATGCGGGGGGTGRNQGPGTFCYCGGNGAPGIMVIKWQQ